MPTTSQQTGFDVEGARKAGYSDDEILQHLTQSRGFDIQGAVKSGYSKQEIINHLSANKPVEQVQAPAAPVPGAPGGVPPGIPAPPYPGDLSPNPPTVNQNMALAMSGQQAQMAPSEQKDFESGKSSALIAAGTAIPAAAGIGAGGLAAAPAVGRGLVGGLAGGYAGGLAGQKVGGYFGHPEAGGMLGATIGGLAGGYKAGKGGKLPGKLGEWFGGAETGAETAAVKPSPFPEGATSTAAPVGNAKLPAPPSGGGSTTATGSLKATPPPNIQYVQKFGAPEKGIIVDPNSPPPPINKTLVSYDAQNLLQMAKRGDIDAINELIRNPRGINLKEALPNVKFLMEQGRSTRIYGGPGSTKNLLPAIGMVGAEFSKLGMADKVTPRQQTTLETLIRGPKWADFDKSEKIEAIRDILGRK